jgi:hypothetical protein
VGIQNTVGNQVLNEGHALLEGGLVGLLGVAAAQQVVVDQPIGQAGEPYLCLRGCHNAYLWRPTAAMPLEIL